MSCIHVRARGHDRLRYDAGVMEHGNNGVLRIGDSTVGRVCMQTDACIRGCKDVCLEVGSATNAVPAAPRIPWSYLM